MLGSLPASDKKLGHMVATRVEFSEFISLIRFDFDDFSTAEYCQYFSNKIFTTKLTSLDEAKAFFFKLNSKTHSRTTN